MTSDRKLKASREGSKCRIYRSQRTLQTWISRGRTRLVENDLIRADPPSTAYFGDPRLEFVRRLDAQVCQVSKLEIVSRTLGRCSPQNNATLDPKLRNPKRPVENDLVRADPPTTACCISKIAIYLNRQRSVPS